ncbi:MAG: hypothetical protein WC593_03885 [Methanoregula sp.]
MDILMLGIKRTFIDWVNSSPDRVSIIILIITNFVCNNIFLFNLKYNSDDWALLVYPGQLLPISKALSHSQRPISYTLFAFGQHIADNVLLFHLLAFITTTIALIIIYFIFKRIFRDFGFENEFYPFIGAMVFCTLFNKDEIYPWATVSFGFAYIAYILTIHLYLNKEKKYYLNLSLFVYFLALLSYEVGIAIPAFLLLYDYLIGKDWKKSFYFVVPLILYLVIRFTKWFGFGWTDIERGFGTYSLGMIMVPLKSLIITGYVFVYNLINSAYGYAQMGIALIVFLCIINIVLLSIIYKYLKTLLVSKKVNIKLIYVAITLIVVFFVPYFLRGGVLVETRDFYLMDIGFALLLVCVLMQIMRFTNIKSLAILIIVLGIFVNQGLFYNWVVSGNVLERIDNTMKEHIDTLSKCDYIYFNTKSFKDNLPNEYELGALPFYSTYQGVRNKLFGPPFDYGYTRYYNAATLDTSALSAMINAHKKTNYTLIGPYYGIAPIDVTQDTITYKNPSDETIVVVSRDKVFEINYSVISFDRSFSVM